MYKYSPEAHWWFLMSKHIYKFSTNMYKYIWQYQKGHRGQSLGTLKNFLSIPSEEYIEPATIYIFFLWSLSSYGEEGHIGRLPDNYLSVMLSTDDFFSIQNKPHWTISRCRWQLWINNAVISIWLCKCITLSKSSTVLIILIITKFDLHIWTLLNNCFEHLKKV